MNATSSNGTAVASAAAPASRSRRPSLRLRLTLWMVTIALVIQLTLGLVVFLYQASALGAMFDDLLRDRSEMLAQDLERSPGEPPDLAALAKTSLTFPTDQARFVTVYDEAGARLAHFGEVELPADAVATAAAGATRPGIVLRRPLGHGGGPWRVLVRRVKDADGAARLLVVGRPDDVFAAMLEKIRHVLIFALPVGVIGAGVAGWMISGLAVAPVRRIREMADSLAPETIEQPVTMQVGVAELEDVQAVLEEMRDRIRQAFIARDKFIANVSHELKTPIAVILTEAQTLDVSGLNREARAFVRSVIDETRRLSRTIESFLTLTKIRAGKSLMEHAPCAASDFVMDAVLGCSRMARQSQVTLNPLLAEAEQPRPLIGDCELLRVMVDNLLRNAVKFSPPNTQVVVQVTETANECVISVRDEGPVMPASMVDSPYAAIVQQGNGSLSAPDTGSSRGIGVGLSIAQTIAELHAGRIVARNLPTGGCELQVSLPFEPAGAAMLNAGGVPTSR